MVDSVLLTRSDGSKTEVSVSWKYGFDGIELLAVLLKGRNVLGFLGSDYTQEIIEQLDNIELAFEDKKNDIYLTQHENEISSWINKGGWL